VSLRQAINQKPAVAATAVGCVALLGVLFIVRMSSATGQTNDVPARAYFTVDDGKSYFEDDLEKIPPFTTAEGKTAYRAVVVKCGNGQPYVSHLERYAEADRKSLMDTLQKPTGRNTVLLEVEANALSMAEVKKPLTGDKGWITAGGRNGRQYEALAQPKCRDGSYAQRVLP
jgi:hypothetical protein